MKLQQEHAHKDKELGDKENVLMSLERKVESSGLTVVQLEAFVTRMEDSFKQNYEQDFAIMYFVCDAGLK